MRSGLFDRRSEFLFSDTNGRDSADYDDSNLNSVCSRRHLKLQRYRPGDLSVRILSVGVIDPITGDIVPRPPSSPYDLVAVRFDIANAGTASTGPWYFSAQLPTVPPYMYSSVAQISLAPGDHIENMLRFRQAAPGGNFSVAVDGANLVLESIEANNFASQNI
ncbi:MAG: hypothetical protein UY81_C0043G0006 [Candidatus Giovannonibacteria bacterium GW2011_GWA2_53_7]|uniref:CARDB domain-containing protein n=1 Tax=Candidatus Giovannonibacteria bacterium GW2011_GWA2_53_7 TaxID=1618650 RepID=A0A0G2ARG8_9BACT|nr:MAG: hypothetical protein UY81_C0043G0006 [Candidatus Giovannonibacteria bacterium GW2011_GWA2_53_7]